MAIKRRVGGYRNIENFKTAIFFYCGGLKLYPQQTQLNQNEADHLPKTKRLPARRRTMS